MPDLEQLYVSEIFGPTFQGEGPNTGKVSYFVRLGGCNLNCHWCDTPYTWRFNINIPHKFPTVYDKKEEITSRDPVGLYCDLLELSKESKIPINHLIITGGEPLLQLPALITFIELLNALKHPPKIEIETAGTVSPGYLKYFQNVHFNVSPKLKNSMNSKANRYKPDILEEFSIRALSAIFKFVVTIPSNKEDIEEINEICEECYILPQHVWLMPEGIDKQTIDIGLYELSNIALKYGYNISNRLHIQLWGNKRGV